MAAKRATVKRESRCRFCAESNGRVDYKDIYVLQRMVTRQGRIFSRKRSGTCAHCQRQLKKAVKRARFLALLPFVGS